VGGVRLTVFWERMYGRFGEAYADNLARDLVIAGLGGRTVRQALEAGLDPSEVWHAVCDAVEVPVGERH
jgi:tRNA A22 N-methylase